MGVDWSFEMVDAVSLEPLDAPQFECHPYDLVELDLMLVGVDEGPLLDLAKSTPEPNPTPEELDQWLRDGFPPTVISAESVQRCHDTLKPITREQYASFDTVISGSHHHVDKSIQQWFYDDLAKEADRVRAFIADAAARNCAIRMHVW